MRVNFLLNCPFYMRKCLSREKKKLSREEKSDIIEKRIAHGR